MKYHKKSKLQGPLKHPILLFTDKLRLGFHIFLTKSPMQPPEQKSLIEKIASSGAIVTAAILSLGAFRMMLIGERYNIPIFNYLNFSNLLEYSFGAVRTLLVITIPLVAIFLCFKTKLIKLVDTWCWPVLIISATIISVYYYLPKCLTITQRVSKMLIVLGAVFFFALWAILKKWKAVNDQTALILLFAGFLFVFAKINTRAEISSIEDNRNQFFSVITYKDSCRKTDTLRGTRYIPAGTNDFVFVQNDSAHSITAIPMSEIHSISADSIIPRN